MYSVHVITCIYMYMYSIIIIMYISSTVSGCLYINIFIVVILAHSCKILLCSLLLLLLTNDCVWTNELNIPSDTGNC